MSAPFSHTEGIMGIQMPNAVTIDVAGADVVIATDPNLQDSRVLARFEPPQNFAVHDDDGRLTIAARPDYHGGRVELLVGPGESSGQWTVDTHGGTITATGRRDQPLRVGGLFLATGGDSTVHAQYVRAGAASHRTTGKVELTHRRRSDHATVGRGVVAAVVTINGRPQ